MDAVHEDVKADFYISKENVAAVTYLLQVAMDARCKVVLEDSVPDDVRPVLDFLNANEFLHSVAVSFDGSGRAIVSLECRVPLSAAVWQERLWSRLDRDHHLPGS